MVDKETFAPQVTMPGCGVVTPDGWMWILGWALAGVPWAVEEAQKPEFQAKVADFRKRQKQHRLLNRRYDLLMEVAAINTELEELKKS